MVNNNKITKVTPKKGNHVVADQVLDLARKGTLSEEEEKAFKEIFKNPKLEKHPTPRQTLLMLANHNWKDNSSKDDMECPTKKMIVPKITRDGLVTSFKSACKRAGAFFTTHTGGSLSADVALCSAHLESFEKQTIKQDEIDKITKLFAKHYTTTQEEAGYPYVFLFAFDLEACLVVIDDSERVTPWFMYLCDQYLNHCGYGTEAVKPI